MTATTSETETLDTARAAKERALVEEEFGPAYLEIAGYSNNPKAFKLGCNYGVRKVHADLCDKPSLIYSNFRFSSTMDKIRDKIESQKKDAHSKGIWKGSLVTLAAVAGLYFLGSQVAEAAPTETVEIQQQSNSAAPALTTP